MNCKQPTTEQACQQLLDVAQTFAYSGMQPEKVATMFMTTGVSLALQWHFKPEVIGWLNELAIRVETLEGGAKLS